MSAAESPHLLLLPGLLNDARLWWHQTSHLSDLVVPTVADLTDADSMPALAADVLARAPAERFVLAGLSMGGYVALEIMRQAPQRVRALALLDTTARADAPEVSENRRRLMALAEHDFAAVIDELLPRFVHPDHQGDAERTQLIRSMAEQIGQDAFLRQQRAIIGRADSRPDLPAIECPVLVLCGRDDAIAPVEIHQEMVDAIPDARLVVIEQCGHLAPIDQPGRVTEALRAWLREVVA